MNAKAIRDELTSRRHSILSGDPLARSGEWAPAECGVVLRDLKQLGDGELRQLARISGALERMIRGGYGSCEMCKATIEPARLRASPETTRCARCAATKAKGGGRP
jgi:hypothetical protein